MLGSGPNPVLLRKPVFAGHFVPPRAVTGLTDGAAPLRGGLNRPASAWVAQRETP
jgi:hypothetical protein